MFEGVKVYQDPYNNTYHYYIAQNGVITITKVIEGKGIVSGKGFENHYEAEIYLKTKRAEIVEI